MMSSMDLFLSRDCGGGAGPDMELARGAAPDPDPNPIPGPVPVATEVLPVPNAEAPGAEDISAVDPILAGPDVNVGAVDPEAVVVGLLFAKRLGPEVADVLAMPEGAVAAVVDEVEG